MNPRIRAFLNEGISRVIKEELDMNLVSLKESQSKCEEGTVKGDYCVKCGEIAEYIHFLLFFREWIKDIDIQLIIREHRNN